MPKIAKRYESCKSDRWIGNKRLKIDSGVSPQHFQAKLVSIKSGFYWQSDSGWYEGDVKGSRQGMAHLKGLPRGTWCRKNFGIISVRYRAMAEKVKKFQSEMVKFWKSEILVFQLPFLNASVATLAFLQIEFVVVRRRRRRPLSWT